MHREKPGLWLTTLLLVVVSLSSCQPSGNAVAKAPAAVVEKFYSAHLGGDMSYIRDTVQLKRQWLTDDLFAQIEAEMRLPEASDEAPYINGDPFTDSQEYPSGFRLGDVSNSGVGAAVTVIFTMQGGDDRRVNAILKQSGEEWRIDDIEYADGSTLRQLLRHE